jgi:hypothetical protein
MTVWIYIDTNKQVGDKDHLRVFANPDAAETWFQDRLTRSAGGEVIFAARIRPPPAAPLSFSLETALGDDPHDRQGYALPGRIGRLRLVDIRLFASGLVP